jgi:hypothetical protein
MARKWQGKMDPVCSKSSCFPRTQRAESVSFSMTHHLGLTAVAPDPVTGASQKPVRKNPLNFPNSSPAIHAGPIRVLRLFLQTKNHHQQNRELAKPRDWLLPMLMNGQVTVS